MACLGAPSQAPGGRRAFLPGPQVGKLPTAPSGEPGASVSRARASGWMPGEERPAHLAPGPIPGQGGQGANEERMERRHGPRLAPAGQGALAITRCLSILTTYQDTTSITWKLLGPPTRSRLPSPPPPRSESCQVELPGPPLGMTPISTLPASNAQTASTRAHDTTWGMFLPSTPTQSQHKRPFPGALRILHTHI